MIPAQAKIPPAETPNDLSGLVKKILAGEREGEVELVLRYRSCLAIIIRRITRDITDTEDLCQETFRLTLEKLRRGELREPEKLSGFICGVARNLAIDHVRRIRRRELVADAEEIPPVADSAPDQLDALLLKETIAATHTVLQELESKRDRELLYRFYIAEEDKEKICADLNLTSLHFNRVLHRARERFRELYEKKDRSGRRE